MTQIEQYRQFFARSMCAASGGKFTQLEDAVAIVPREKFSRAWALANIHKWPVPHDTQRQSNFRL